MVKPPHVIIQKTENVLTKFGIQAVTFPGTMFTVSVALTTCILIRFYNKEKV